MSDTMHEARATLDKIATEVEAAAAANGSASNQALAIADQVIHRASAAMADVHAHALSRVAGMREQLDDLENTIIEAKERAELHMQKFMKLVTDGEEAVHAMELAVARISDQALAPH
jgi:TolA-binding protein